MSLLAIAKLGNPVLREKAHPVSKDEIGSEEFQTFLENLAETMIEFDGVGLAATQVHVLKQVFVFQVESDPREKDDQIVPLTVVINPTLENKSETMEFEWEGCLSLTGLYGKVSRHHSLLLKGLDPTGAPLELELKGFAARVAQHETDHLNGKVFLDRMENLNTLCFEREFKKFAPTY